MSVNSNPTASQRNKKKTFCLKFFFQFIADVVDTDDLPLLSNISANFRKYLKWLKYDTQQPGGNRLMTKA
jgi:hypothetical protein